MIANRILRMHRRTGGLGVLLAAFLLAVLAAPVPTAYAQRRPSAKKESAKPDPKDDKDAKAKEGDKKDDKKSTAKRRTTTSDRKRSGRPSAPSRSRTSSSKSGGSDDKDDDPSVTKRRAKSTPSRPSRSTTRRTTDTSRTPGRGSRPTPSTRGGSDRTPAAGGESAVIDIPALDELLGPDVPAEEREYSFAVNNASYEQLLETVARQTGLAIVGEGPPDGTVSYTSTDTLTYEEFLTQVRVLLREYKPNNPYTLLRKGELLRVIRVTDAQREIERERMFQSMEEFLLADLPDNELVIVLYTPEGALSDLTEARDRLPDYFRVESIGEQNRAEIFGFVNDIHKYLSLVDFYTGESRDPRTIEQIEIEHILPSQAQAYLETLGIGGEVAGPPQRGRRGKQNTGLDVMPEPPVVIMPLDEEGVLLVRAMQNRIDEIKSLLPYVDVASDPAVVDPVIVPVQNAEPEELIELVQAVLSVSEAGGGANAAAPKPKRRPGKRRGKRGGSPAASSSSGASVLSMIPHPAGDAIIVLTDDEDQLARVRSLISQFDIESRVGPLRIELVHIDAEEAIESIGQLLGRRPAASRGKGAKGAAGASGTAFTLVPDRSGTSIWFTGSQTDLQRVEKVLTDIDSPGAVESLHKYAVQYQAPSFVVQMLQAWEGESGTAPGGKARARRKRKGKAKDSGGNATPRPGKLTARDDIGEIWGWCTDEEWDAYQPLIAEIDQPKDPMFVRVTVEHIEPEVAISRVQRILAASDSPANAVDFMATEDGFVVLGGNSQALADIESVLAEIDKPIDFEKQTFEIKHIAPAEMVRIISDLVGGSARAVAAPSGGKGKARAKRGKRGKEDKRDAKRGLAGGGGNVMLGSDLADPTVTQVGNFLIVQATPPTMQEVADVIDRFDVPATAAREYADFTPNTDITAIAEAIRPLIGAGGGGDAKRAKGAQDQGDVKVIAQPNVHKLVIIAPPSEFERIEELLQIVRVDYEAAAGELVRESFHILHADPETLVNAIQNLVGEQAGEGGGNAKRYQKKRRGKGKAAATAIKRSSDVMVFRMGQQLIVETTPEKMEEVRELVASLDVSETEQRVYEDFPQGADIEGIAAHLTASFGGGGRGKGKAAQAEGAAMRFIAQPAAERIIAIGPRTDYPEVEELLEVLKVDTTVEPIEFQFVPVRHGDPEVIVELIEPLLDMKVAELEAAGALPETEILAPADDGKGGKARRGRRAGNKQGDAGDRYHVAADTPNRRIVIAASQRIAAEAIALIEAYDLPGSDRVTQTVTVRNLSADEMVDALGQLMGTKGRSAGRNKEKSRGKGKAGSGGGTFTGSHGAPFTAVPAPGGGAIVLSGTREDVDQAISWIEEFESVSEWGRDIKTYTIAHADMKTLVNLIMNVVDVPDAGGKKGGKRPRGRAMEEDDDFGFETTITKSGEDIWLQADTVGGKLLVAAPPAKIRAVDDIVAQFDVPETDLGPEAQMASMLYDLEYKDSFDASFDLESLFDIDVFWTDPVVPTVDYLPFGNTLVVSHPREETFDQIRELIAKYIDVVPGEDLEPDTVQLVPPAGATPMQIALWWKMRFPELQIDIVDATNEKVDTGIEQVRPAAASTAHRCILPTAFGHMTAHVLAAVADDDEPAPRQKKAESGDEKPGKGEATVRGKGPGRGPGKGPGKGSVKAAKDDDAEDTEAGPSERRKSARKYPGDANKVQIVVTSDGVIIDGAKGALNDIEYSIDEFKRELEKMGTKPDIRVYRVRHIDVYEAQSIIEAMFNTPLRDQRALRNAQQNARRRAQNARRQQQNKQEEDEKGRGRDDDNAHSSSTPLPSGSVRIYPNPRDRTLIFRADPTQYDAILELLATVDQPKPVQSELKIFPLKRLNAAEVEEMLKETLGLNAAASRRTPARTTTRTNRSRGRTARTPTRTTTTSSAPTLPQPLMADMATGAGKLGVDPKDINITSNSVANTIHVMAPKVAIEYIGGLIETLESHVPEERETRHYVLEYADADDVVEYLGSQFDSAVIGQPSGGRRGKVGRASTTSSGSGSMNPPTFTPYARLNMISAQATEEQFEKIDDLVARIDVKDDEEYRSITLTHADAGDVAGKLTEMFGGGGSAAPRRGRRGSVSPSSSAGAQFIGESGDRILFYTAPERDIPKIESVVAQLEEEAHGRQTPRTITLLHAKPSTVAEAIEAAFGASSPRRSGSRRGRGPTTASGDRFSITAHDESKRLFVLADDQMFEQIESLAQTLDMPEDIGFDVKVYPLKHADAQETYDLLSGLVRDYITANRGGGDIVPFSAKVDVKSNSLIVMGDDVIFDFLEEKLLLVDTPANQRQVPGVLMVTLKNGNAMEVAQNIRSLWSQRAQSRGRGQTAGPPPPQVEANRSLNTLIVRGTQEQLDEIKRDVIDPLEEQQPIKLQLETMTLKHANAEAVADSINTIFEAKAQAMRSVRGPNTSPFEYTVIVTPEVDTKQIIVQASEENMEFIRQRVAELDTPEAGGRPATMKIYPIKYADPASVVRIINEWSRSRSMARGRGRNVSASETVLAVAEQGTQAVVVSANASNHAIVAELINELDNEESNEATQRQPRVLALKHANSDQIAQQLAQVFREGQRARRGDRGPSFVSAPKNNAIVATVNGVEHEKVLALLEELDVPSSLDAKRTTKPYPLRFADPGSINGVILNMFRWDRRTPVGPAEQVTSAVEWATRSVIVTANEENHKVVEDLIAAVDVESIDQKDMIVRRLEYANADEVARALQGFYRGRRTSQRGEQPVQVTPERQTNSLLILAKTSELEELTSLIDQLDVESDLGQRMTVPYTLKYADPGSLNSVILNMFRWDRRTQVSPSEQVTCAVDWGTRSVIVTANDKNHTTIAKLIEEVDIEGAVDRAMHVRRLEHASADEVSRALSNVYRGRRRGQRGEQVVQITPERQTNTLLILANDEELEELDRLIKDLDVPPDIESQIRTFTLRYADPQTVQDAVNRLFRSSSRNPRDQVTAVPEHASRSVIVSASETNMARVEALITDIDSADTGQRIVKVLPVENAEAAGVARALDQIYVRSAARSRAGEQPITVSEIRGADAILVKANEEDLVKIEQTVAELDTAGAADRKVKVFEIENTDPAGVARALDAIYVRSSNRGRGGGEQPITVSEIRGSKSILVKADEQDMAEIAETVAELDKSGFGEDETVKVVPLSHTDASEMQTILQESLRKPGASGRNAELLGDLRIGVLTQANAIVLTGSEEQVAELVTEIEALDGDAGETGSRTRVIRLEHADLNLVLPIVQASFGEGSSRSRGRGRGASQEPPVIEGIEAINGIMVKADPMTATEIMDLVAELDIEDIGTPETFRIVAVPAGIDVVELGENIETMINDSADILANSGGSGRSTGRRGGSTPHVTIIPDPRSNSLLVSGSASLFDEVESFVKDLGEAKPPQGETITILTPNKLTAEEIQSLYDQLKGESSSGSSSRRSSARSGSSRSRSGRGSANSSRRRRR